jgi:cyclase
MSKIAWRAWATGLLIVTGVSSAAAQVNPDSVQITATYVGVGVYMLAGSGGNIGLCVGDDGPFLVDDQYAPLTPKIKTAIAAITPQPVKFVLNTHWHGDHTGGNEHMGDAGALIIAQENVRKRMSTEQLIEFLDMRTPPSPPIALPIVTFTEDVTVYWNGETIHATHAPHAHTDGDAIIHFENANVFHMGDTFFNGAYPFIDLSSGGGINGVIAAADRVLALANSRTRIIPGHGPLAGVQELQRYRSMLVTIRDRVATMINDGLSEGDVVRESPTAEFDAVYGGAFIRPNQFATLVYRSLKNGT